MANTTQIFQLQDTLNAASIEGYNATYQSIFTDLVLAKTENINDLTIGQLLEIHDQASEKFNQLMDK